MPARDNVRIQLGSRLHQVLLRALLEARCATRVELGRSDGFQSVTVLDMEVVPVASREKLVLLIVVHYLVLDDCGPRLAHHLGEQFGRLEGAWSFSLRVLLPSRDIPRLVLG